MSPSTTPAASRPPAPPASRPAPAASQPTTSTASRPTALFVSPHLDDVAFSCGGLAALLADAGWRTVLATVFTRSVVPAIGFALACQLDKGLDAGVDYMALRRDEDRDAAGHLGFTERRDLDLPEAPHRGYASAAALFAGPRDDDTIWREVADRLAALHAELHPDLILAPQGLGHHADHLQVRRAVLRTFAPTDPGAPGSPGSLSSRPVPLLPACPVWWYRDTPYAIRHGDAPAPEILSGLTSFAIPIAPALERKLAAACAYRSQIGFQFGGPSQTASALRDFARAEAEAQARADTRVQADTQAHAEAQAQTDAPRRHPAPDAGTPPGRAAAPFAERFLGLGQPHAHPAYAAAHPAATRTPEAAATRPPATSPTPVPAPAQPPARHPAPHEAVP